MSARRPHFVLTTHIEAASEAGPEAMRWQFRLHNSQNRKSLTAKDIEPSISLERLELLVLVRALEALEQPARVSYLGAGSQIRRGLRYGIPQWREQDWHWDYFDQLVPLPNADLWQRIAHALGFHELHCRKLRVDEAHPLPESKRPRAKQQRVTEPEVVAQSSEAPSSWRRLLSDAKEIWTETWR